MKNKQILNICYKFFNRYLIADELVKQLTNIDKTGLSKEDINETEKLVNGIKDILANTPNEVDEYVSLKKAEIKRHIDEIEKASNNEESKEFFKNSLEGLKESYDKEIDSHDRWFKVVDYINKNEYFNKCYDSQSPYELLEFIAQNLHAPFPPQITQKKKKKIVQAGIEKDEREWLWRLAFNYDDKGINFDTIVDYYIKVKDAYYISELISAVGRSLDIDKLIDKVTDKKLADELIEYKPVIDFYCTDEQMDKLIKKGEIVDE